MIDPEKIEFPKKLTKEQWDKNDSDISYHDGWNNCLAACKQAVEKAKKENNETNKN